MMLEVKMTLTFIDLFAGMGGIRLAFESVGAQCVFSSEWDDHAQRIYQANFGEVPYGDITQIDSRDIPNHDILLGGFPCQPFSIIGEKLGFADTRGTLFFEIERILHDKQPQAFLLENVKQLVTHDDGRTFGVILNTLQVLGYTVYWRILACPKSENGCLSSVLSNRITFSFPYGRANRKRWTIFWKAIQAWIFAMLLLPTFSANGKPLPNTKTVFIPLFGTKTRAVTSAFCPIRVRYAQVHPSTISW
jgi:hypothetical protein